MIGVRIEGTFHWGYWVRVPGTSKMQPSLPLPTPTTLIGALSMPLVRSELIKCNGKEVGEFTIEASESGRVQDFKSSAAFLDRAVIGCAVALKTQAMYWEDINKYNTLFFQTLTKNTAEEKTAGGRRYLLKYLTGAITAGKVIYPSGEAVLLFILDEEILEKILSSLWRRIIENACWSITRVGSKESIFSVNKVQILKPKEVKGTVRTRFYFPAKAGKPKIGEKYYMESFWKGGWGRYDPPFFIDYIVPGGRSPIASESIRVDVQGKAYEFGPEEVLLVS